MGLLLVGVVAGILIGFAWLSPTQGHLHACMFQWQGCFDGTAANGPIRPTEPLPAAYTPEPKSRVAAKSAKQSTAKQASAKETSAKETSAKSHKRVAVAKEVAPPAKVTPSNHGPVETHATAQDHGPSEPHGAADAHGPAETSDFVLTMAKASVAAKMENPATAEFTDIDRAFRMNTFGRAVDSVCGHVKGKNASGGDTGEKPFLYLVKEDEAYVVEGRPDSAAAITYRNICH